MAKARDMRICSECGREYNALEAHECTFSADQVALSKAAKAAGMDEDEYAEAVIVEGRKPRRNA